MKRPTLLLASTAAIFLGLASPAALHAQKTPHADDGEAGARPPKSPMWNAGARPASLDEVLKSARSYNRDLRASRERLSQAGADIDRAWAALLPIVNLQGKYTFNEPAVEVKFVGEAAGLSGQISAAGAQATGVALQDLYTQTQKIPGAPVFAAQQAVTDATKKLTDYCAANPNEFGCSASSDPTVIVPRNQLDLNITAQIPIVVPWAWFQLRAARTALVAQEKQITATEAQILQQVAGVYYQAASADEAVAALQHGIEVAQRTLRDAEIRFQAGVVNRVEVMRAKVALLRREQGVRDALDGARSLYRALRTLSGVEGDVRVQMPAEPAPVETDTAGLQAEALRLRPELAAIETQLDAARLNVKSNQFRWAPTLSAFGLARFFNYGGFANRNNAFAFGLQLDWLIYDGGMRQAATKQFQSIIRETEVRKGLLREQISDEVANLRDQVGTKRTALGNAREELKLASDTLDLVRVQREAGTATQLDLLTAQDALVMAELSLARLRSELSLLDLQLQRAIGAFPGPPQ